jgi:Na+(H+)/acetate symporter ActP
MVVRVDIQRLQTPRLIGVAFERDVIYAGLPHVLYRLFSTSSARSTSRSVV